MKDGFVLFVICVVAIGGIALWMLHIDVFHASAGGTAPRVEAPQATRAAGPPAKPKQSLKPVKPPVVEEAAVVQPAPAPVVPAAPIPAPAVAADAPPFPSVDQITVGLQEERITEAYGDPSLS